jgi:hypothetical protein
MRYLIYALVVACLGGGLMTAAQHTPQRCWWVDRTVGLCQR